MSIYPRVGRPAALIRRTDHVNLLRARATGATWRCSRILPTRKAAAQMTEKSGKTFELSDRATGRSAQLPVRNGTFGPAALDIANLYKDLGRLHLRSRASARRRPPRAASPISTAMPACCSTAATRSSSWPSSSSFMEVAYLLLIGELPTAKQLRGVHRQHPLSHDDQRVAAAFLQRLPPQRASDGDGVGRGGLDVGLLSRHDGHP